MRIFEIAARENNSFEVVDSPAAANWAIVSKSDQKVQYYSSNSPIPPFSPGRSNVWFIKSNGKWEEVGDHGKYTYGHYLK